MSFRLGLTGSIGMGKSTTARMFADAGLPVWDADAAVHRLYAPGGAAVEPVARLCPPALKNNGIDRSALRQWIAAAPENLGALEALVHPLVTTDRASFLAAARADLVILDIPLLFETATETDFDATLLVTAPERLQCQRVLSRPGMTPAQFVLLRSRQMPDAEKRARATHIVETLSIPQTRAYVQALIAHLAEAPKHA
jgi:dephospho-CoA kinase